MAWIVMVWLSGCSTESRTQVIAVINAEPGIRSQARTLRVLVYGGEQAGDTVPTERSLDRPYPVSTTQGWPVLVALAPKDKDSGRIYRIVATAHSDTTPSDTNAIAEVRAISGYVPNRTLSLSLLLQDSCQGQDHLGCAIRETCKNGSCQTAVVDKTILPPYEPNSTGDGGVLHDSGNTVSDAGVDGGSSCEHDTDCPTLSPTNCSECREPSGSVCAMYGTQNCVVPVGHCELGRCTTKDMEQSLSCNRFTEGISCGEPLYGAWGPCKPVSSNLCDVNGQQQRNVTVYTCIRGGCQFSDHLESQNCTLNTEGLSCGNAGWCGQGNCVETHCSDGYDNDFDGLCDNGTCSSSPGFADGDCACVIPGYPYSVNCFETSCYNGQDDDLDGFVDCYDRDCWVNNRPCGYAPGYYCENRTGVIGCNFQ